ncbi:MAG: rubrerythrin family protein [Thermodesulfobacteriota bacterium]|nr:rubrerythrin family protein [Thermodesulfobacteriota bacterium]
MELKGSKTEKNLLLAYAGESLNRNLYTYFASQAKEEGYEQIAAIFAETADHEKEHARQELKFIRTREVEIAGVLPVNIVGDTASNLETAVAGEHYEQTVMYPEFAGMAEEEGFNEIAEMLRYIAFIEAWHEKRYLALLNNVKEGRVFKKDKLVEWKCRLCGYINEGNEAPMTCPVCSYDRAYFELLIENY